MYSKGGIYENIIHNNCNFNIDDCNPHFYY